MLIFQVRLAEVLCRRHLLLRINTKELVLLAVQVGLQELLGLFWRRRMALAAAVAVAVGVQ
jgi:predicted membrane-bound mannosyltransferase